MAILALKPVNIHAVARRGARSETFVRPSRSRIVLSTQALLGPDGKPGTTGGSKKKFITREEEPEQYWSSKGEQAGANPMKDPLAIIGVVAIFFPFLFLAVAVATGVVDLSVYK